ncbi:MAG: hypothetical protein Q8K51_01150, partial [Nitrospirota bacterium]|nr:hypothetical protein [Nitrospirota bacterium]
MAIPGKMCPPVPPPAIITLIKFPVNSEISAVAQQPSRAADKEKVFAVVSSYCSVALLLCCSDGWH